MFRGIVHFVDNGGIVDHHCLNCFALFCFQGLGYKISLLEETFEAVIKSLPVNKACEVYHSLLLKQIEAKENLEQDIWSMVSVIITTNYLPCIKLFQITQNKIYGA